MTEPSPSPEDRLGADEGLTHRNGDRAGDSPDSRGQPGVGGGRGDGPTPARSPLRMRMIIAALAVAGLVGLTVAALVGTGGGGAGDAVTAGPAVTRVIPEPGDEVLQQQRVGVVLDARYRLTALTVFPNDRYTGGVNVFVEVDEVEGLNMFEFAPGEGRLIEALSPDDNCVRATFVPIARPDESDTTQWCFSVS